MNIFLSQAPKVGEEWWVLFPLPSKQTARQVTVVSLSTYLVQVSTPNELGKFGIDAAPTIQSFVYSRGNDTARALLFIEKIDASTDASSS